MAPPVVFILNRVIVAARGHCAKFLAIFKVSCFGVIIMGGIGSTRWDKKYRRQTLISECEVKFAAPAENLAHLHALNPSCPRCKRHCKYLYRPTPDASWACRVCHDLTYPSRFRTTHETRDLHSQEWHRLGWRDWAKIEKCMKRIRENATNEV
jgi:hypothetical protein